MIFAALYIVIAVSLFAATIFASGNEINWTGFSAAAFVMIIAILIDRKLKKRNIEKKGEDGFSSDSLLRNFYKLVELCEFYKENLTYDDKEKIEEVFTDAQPDIEEARFALINEIKIENYTNLISIYANAERKMNRAVSAAIDGYIKAAKESFKESITILNDCIKELKEIKSE